jgi:C-terminal processing protease CtpA/Prc
MSGLSLSSRGTFLDSLYIDHVRDGSPADLAGIRENDIILNINGYNHSYHPMSIMLAILRKKPKNKIRMKILRGDEKLKKVFRLKRTI